MTLQHARILKAWCVDLNEEVTITQARREYTNQTPAPPRYTFHCNDPACLSLPQKVTITGVNYTVVAEESPKYKSAHFRLKAAHHEACGWLTKNDATAEEPSNHSAYSQRAAKRKLTDLVTAFDPRSAAQKNNHNHATSGSSSQEGNDLGHERLGVRRPRNDENNEATGETRTSDLDRLVDSYLEAKNQLTHAEFQALRLKIVGSGECRFDDYFQWIGRADGNGVMYGGTYVKSYGYGFNLTFRDELNGKRVNIYISSDNLKNFKYRASLRKSVDDVLASDDRKYLKVYCLGVIEKSEKFDNWSIIIEDLNHLVLRVITKNALD
ncbi:hypothetical protein [Delftia lacustris]|uniref:hypothetical protein n=1 Tax=Delftia lacustris TaxID=558537 RepID=UPI0035A6628F